MKGKLILDGKSLDVLDIYRFVHNKNISVELSPATLARVSKSYLFLKKRRKDSIIYGVNTGFGPMASHIISDKRAVDLQENLIRSHAVGMGEMIDEKLSLASMLVRLNALIKGYSGVSLELIGQLQKFVNLRLIPVIYEHGAVGTSGDLVQLAHIALALMGEGELFYEGQRQQSSSVLKKLGIRPYKLKAKEGLSLINGTSVMSAIAAIVCVEARNILNLEITMGALSLELVGGFRDSIAKKLGELRPHGGQTYVADRLRSILSSSKLLKDRAVLKIPREIKESVHQISDSIQEVYSLRCLAQILGPVRESIETARKIVEIEINSVTDNPIVDWKKGDFIHGGNFHGDYGAYAVDQLKMTLVKLSLLSERRINFFLHSEINKSFPPFLNLNKPGLTLALQGLQFVATSTAAQNQTLAFPQYVHSISTNGDNQDIVSMGTDAALLCAKVIDNNYIVQAIETITLAQCVDFLNCADELSRITKKMFTSVRKIFPKVVEDRVIPKQLQDVVSFLKTLAGEKIRNEYSVTKVF